MNERNSDHPVYEAWYTYHAAHMNVAHWVDNIWISKMPEANQEKLEKTFRETTEQVYRLYAVLTDAISRQAGSNYDGTP